MHISRLRMALLLTVLGAVWLPAAAWALPDQILQEGLLLDDGDQPLEGQHRLRVRLYPAAAGGQPIFEEVHPAVVVFQGYYAIAIGSEQALPDGIFARPALYLGLSIDGGPELTPRTPLGKVPAAFVADVAQDAVGDIHPSTVSIGERLVIDGNGRWVGERGAFATSLRESDGYRDAAEEASKRLKSLLQRAGI